MLIYTYVYGIAIPASKINLITIMGNYKSFQNSFPYEILATIPNTSYYRLMKGESRTHAQHPFRVAYGKGPDTKFKNCCFLQRVVWTLAIRSLSSLEKFGKYNLCNSYRKLFKQIHVYINCIFLIKISKNKKKCQSDCKDAKFYNFIG